MSEQPEDSQPLTASPDVVVDAWGDARFMDLDDPGQQQASTGYYSVGAGPVLVSSIASGAINTDFMQGPPARDLPIGEENKLPGWTYTQVQGGVAAYWEADADGAAGYVVAFRFPSTSVTGDEAYIEQIVPVGPGQGVMLVQTAGTNDGLNLTNTCELQPLAYDGSTVGSPISTTFTLDIGVGALVSTSGARWVRVRLGAAATGTDGGTVAYEVVRVGDPKVSYATFTGSEDSLPATGAQTLYVASANGAGTPVNAASSFIAPAVGWVVAISAKTSANVTGATCEVYVRNETTAAAIGHADLTVGVSKAYTTLQYDASINSFVAGDELHLEAFVPSGTLTSTTADILAHAVLALII